jgi:hypothetical protein
MVCQSANLTPDTGSKLRSDVPRQLLERHSPCLRRGFELRYIRCNATVISRRSTVEKRVCMAVSPRWRKALPGMQAAKSRLQFVTHLSKPRPSPPCAVPAPAARLAISCVSCLVGPAGRTAGPCASLAEAALDPSPGRIELASISFASASSSSVPAGVVLWLELFDARVVTEL